MTPFNTRLLIVGFVVVMFYLVSNRRMSVATVTPPVQAGFNSRVSVGEETSWRDSVRGAYTGSAFSRTKCDKTGNAAEWTICLTHVEESILRGDCLVYSFGIAKDDPFTNFMAEKGCQVYAFDPAQNHPHLYKPNVLFYQYGLVSGIVNESSFEHMHWGRTDKAQYKTLEDIQLELGHTDSRITVMKIDCEGCEWNLFANMNDKAMGQVEQLLTELHYTKSLRYTCDIAKRYTQACIENLAAHFDAFYFAPNAGAWYDMHVDECMETSFPTIPRTERQLKDGRTIVTNIDSCCQETGFLNRNIQRRAPAGP